MLTLTIFIYFLSAVASILGVISFFNIIIVIVFYLISQLVRKHKYSRKKYSLSIIIPAFNEQDNIANCLESVIACNKNLYKYEIICVNDRSTDKTLEILKTYADRNKKIRILQGLHEGKAKALNLAISKARNPLVLFLDADMIIEKEYIQLITAPFSNKTTGCTLGPILVEPLKSMITYYQAIEYYFMNLVRESTTNLFKYPFWFSGQAVCFRKKVLEEIGGFQNDTLTEDFDLTLRLFPKYKTVFVKRAIASTKPLASFSSLLKQRARWYFGGIQGLIKNLKSARFSYLVILYVYFSYSLWMFNSLLIFPVVLYSFFYLLVARPYLILSFWLHSGTILGPFLYLYELLISKTFSGIVNLIYIAIGFLMVALYAISILSVGKKLTPRLVFAYFSYFSYMSFLQASFIFSFFKYVGLKKVSFVKEG